MVHPVGDSMFNIHCIMFQISSTYCSVDGGDKGFVSPVQEFCMMKVSCQLESPKSTKGQPNRMGKGTM